MATRGVKISIGADDRASAAIERITNRVAALQRPAKQTFAAMQRFSHVSGLSTLRNGFFQIARVGREAFHALGSIVPVLGALTGAATLGGLVKLTASWAKLGGSIQTTSRAIGIAPQRLMQMQSAAALAGGSAESMSSALSDMSQTQWRAANGFDPAALATFQSLGVTLRDLKTLRPDALFERVANKLRGIKNPAAQAVAATRVFGGAAAGLLPVLQQSETAYKANLRQAEKYGVINKRGAEAASSMQRSLTGLNLAASGLGYQIAENVAPYIKTVVDSMAGWITRNREWIATGIGRVVREVGDGLQRLIAWLKDGGWDTIVRKAENFTHALGGWRAVAIEAAGAIAVLWAAPVITGFALLLSSVLKVTAALKGMKTAQVAASLAESESAIGGGLVAGKQGAAARLGSKLGAIPELGQLYTMIQMAPKFGDYSPFIDALHQRTDYQAASPDVRREMEEKLLKGLNVKEHFSEAWQKKPLLWGMGLGGSLFEDHDLKKIDARTQSIGVSREQFLTFAESVAGIEHARYDQMGGAQGAYAGKYQMGPNAIKDAAGYLYEPVPSKSEFLHNPEMQEKFFRAFTMKNFEYLQKCNPKFARMSGAEKLAVLGYAHNQGAGGANQWLNTGKVRRDAFGTAGTVYANRILQALNSDKVSGANLIKPPAGHEGLADRQEMALAVLGKTSNHVSQTDTDPIETSRIEHQPKAIQVIAPTSEGPRTGANGSGRNDTLRIEIDHKNAPEGSRVSLSRKPDYAKLGAVRQSRAMNSVGSSTGY